MSNFNKASKLASEWVESMGGLDNISYRHGDDVSGLVQAIDDAGLLAPDLQIIRTVEELEALDPMAIVQPNPSGDFHHEVVRAESLLYVVSRWGWEYRLPAAVIATGAQVREAREALAVIDE